MARTPIFVTPRAVRAFHQKVKHAGIEMAAYLCVSVDSNGQKASSIGTSYDPKVEECFEADGVLVVVRFDELNIFRGAIVDYDESIYLSSFSIRVPPS